MLKPNELGAQTLIERLGTECIITPSYYLRTQAVAGSTEIQVFDSIGLLAGGILSIYITDPTNPLKVIGGAIEEIKISAVERNRVVLTSPLSDTYPARTLLSVSYNVKGMPLIKSTDISRDDVEFTRRIRVRKDLLINYGTTVDYSGRTFFVVGLDNSDLTLLLKLREVNESVTIYSRARSGKYNGFDFDYDTPDYTYENVPCWDNHLSSGMDDKDPGLLPTTYQMISIPKILPISIGDFLIRGSDGMRLKVIGTDVAKINGFTTLAVDIETSTSVISETTPEPISETVPNIPPGAITDDW